MAAVYGHLAATLGTVAPEAETIAGDDVTGTYIYRFRSDRGHVIAAWTQAKGSSLAVSCNKPMELLNIMGSSMTIGTHFVTPLGPCPVLVRTTERCPFEIKANRIMTRSR